MIVAMPRAAFVAAVCLLLACGCGILPKRESSFVKNVRQMEAIQKRVLDRITTASELPEKDQARIAACRESADDLVQVMRMTEKMERTLREEGKIVFPAVLIDLHNGVETAWSSLAVDKIDEELLYQLAQNLITTQRLMAPITRVLSTTPTPFDSEHPAWKFIPADKQKTWNELSSEERQALKQQALKKYEKEKKQQPQK